MRCAAFSAIWCTKRSCPGTSASVKRPATANRSSCTTFDPEAPRRTSTWRRSSWSMKRKALGKGLSSLIPSSIVKVPVPAVPPMPPRPADLRLEVSKIRPNPRQPRRSFDEASLDELAGSMKSQGRLQPVVVRPMPDGSFELIAGERRWRAAQRAGIHRIPAVVRDVPDEKLLELALIENVQREELNPIEEAEAYRILADDLGLTQQEIADRVGKQRTSIANAIGLLNLPASVQQMVRGKQISMGHARAL